MTRTGLIYHTDFNGIEVQHTKKDLHYSCKVFDELIVLSADLLEHPVVYNNRLTNLLNNLKAETKVVLGTSHLTTNFQSAPNIKMFQEQFPKLDFTGTYFNEESFFHPQFKGLWNALNKIEGRKIWIPYTGSWKNELYTLPQIALLSNKFDKVFVQPNYYQKKYNKKLWNMKYLKRFIENHNLGVEFEIDNNAIKSPISDTDRILHAARASEYFTFFEDIEDKAFYTGGLDIGNCPEFYQMMVNDSE